MVYSDAYDATTAQNVKTFPLSHAVLHHGVLMLAHFMVAHSIHRTT